MKGLNNAPKSVFLIRVGIVLIVSVVLFLFRILMVHNVGADLSHLSEQLLGIEGDSATGVGKTYTRSVPNEVSFSGLYRPDLTKGVEHYAGAWLVPKRRLLESLERVNKITYLEGATFSIVGYEHDERLTLMTRDFFDFQVIHLSSTTNQMPLTTTTNFLNALSFRMYKTVQELKNGANSSISHHHSILPHNEREKHDKRAREKTIAVIPFCSLTASHDLTETEEVERFQGNIRLHYFQATFWSTYKHFPHIIVTVSSKRDLDILAGKKNMNQIFKKNNNIPFFSLI